MKRREFIRLLGAAAAALPLTARAQQPGTPVIGFLHSGSPAPNANRLAGFRKGLRAAGFIEGQNVAIEFRWAEGQNDRLPGMAADLVRRNVAVIATLSASQAAVVAKSTTTTIPIVFQVGSDPVAMGLVASLNRPGGNATGISTLSTELTAKKLGLLRELLPQIASVSALVNPTNPSAEPVSNELQATAGAMGMKFRILRAGNDREIEAAFADLAPRPGGALVIATDPFFFIRRAQLITLAAREAVPTIYYDRQFAVAGGLMSYGTDSVGAWELAGTYVGRVLKGEKPSDLPVVQPTSFELVINLKTARMLGLTIPTTLLATADEVIE